MWKGQAAWRQLEQTALLSGRSAPIVVDTYPGVDLNALQAQIAGALPGWQVIDVEKRAAIPSAELEAMVSTYLTNDRVFGILSPFNLTSFYDPLKLEEIARAMSSGARTVLVGWGASLVPVEDRVLVLADLARWEIQQRYRAGMPNWNALNDDDDILRKFKRGYFVEWRIADRHKRGMFDAIDYLLDTNHSAEDAKLITSSTFREGLRKATTEPFRVVPFFDPGVWGGQWMKNVCGLDEAPNYAWCFDCVPEENSLLLAVSGETIELPSIDLVFLQPRELLGELTYARFGAEFPIRFDFLDTMGGGNLSLQVHPLTDYIQNEFGMRYTQDESYYLLDAADDAVVYLGLKTGREPQEMIDALETASSGGESFDAEAYVNVFPAKKHDHFLIPAGTVHCSGANSMVLEISATPYIFTFKMWDWDRLGLDGRPRPIHLQHAKENIQWDRDTEWTKANLVDQVRELDRGDGWVEETTGLHEFEFIEVRRHWFTETVQHDTHGTVNVLNLVEGVEAIVESPTGAFEPFVVHYAETFIVPAQVGQYTLRPLTPGGEPLATVKAFVRGTER